MAIALRNAGHPVAIIHCESIIFEVDYQSRHFQCDEELQSWQRDFIDTLQAEPMRFELDWNIGMARMI